MHLPASIVLFFRFLAERRSDRIEGFCTLQRSRRAFDFDNTDINYAVPSRLIFYFVRVVSNVDGFHIPDPTNIHIPLTLSAQIQFSEFDLSFELSFPAVQNAKSLIARFIKYS